ncbi:MAG: energy-coupling factor transporter transmembrane component T [Chloroflexota bacterium]
MTNLVNKNESPFELDPRTKLLLLLLVNLLLYSYGSQWPIYGAVVFAAVLVFIAGAIRPLFAMAIMYAILFLLDYLVGFTSGAIVQVWNGLSLQFFIFLPFFMYSLLFFATTSIGDAAAAFQKMRMPHFLLIPLLVMFRFFPTIRQEFRAITNAMRLRGAVGQGNPFRTIEYIYVPLLFSLVKTGEELTLASLTRGLGLHKDRTYVNDPKMGWFDFVALGVMVALIVMRRLGVFA